MVSEAPQGGVVMSGNVELNVVTIVTVRAEDLQDRFVVRPHDSPSPWRRVDFVVHGYGGNGIEDVIVAAGGDPKATNDSPSSGYSRWPFESPAKPVPDHQFHTADVAIGFTIPDRKGDTFEQWAHDLVITEGISLWDVQVLTPSPLKSHHGELS